MTSDLPENSLTQPEPTGANSPDSAETPEPVTPLESAPAAIDQPAAKDLPAGKEQPAAKETPAAKSASKPAPAAKIAPEKKVETRRTPFGSIVAALGLFLLQIILPVILAGVIAWFLFSNFNLWQQMDRTVGLILFGAAVVVASILLYSVVDAIAGPFRKAVRVQGARFTSTPQARLVMMVLGGLLVPLAAVIAANTVVVGPQGNLMNLVVASAAARPVVVAPPEEVGAIALQSTNPSTKQLSIQVLEGFRSPEGLAQLMRLVDQDRAALNDPGVSGTLAQAIAVYGLEAKPGLLSAFKAIDPAQAGGVAAGGAIGSGDDLYTRYFAQSFESLKAEVTGSSAEAAVREARLAQLAAAQAQLKQTLSNVQGAAGSTGAATNAAVKGSDPRLDFILQTFLAMNITQDADLLAFARTTAVDARYSTAVRGDSLLLIGKLGSKDDLNTLYPFLKVGDNLIQTRALQAIRMIQAKASSSQAK